MLLLAACGSGEEPSADGAETDTVSAEPAATRGADAAPGPAPVTIDVYIREGAIAAGLDRAGVIARFGEPDSVVRIAVPNRHDPAVTDSVVTLEYAGARYVFYVVTAGGGYDILDGAEVESNEHLRHTAPGIGTPEASLRAWFGEHGVERERELEYDCASCEVPQPVTFELDADDRVRRIRFDYYVD